jgi:hypothetical protein
MNICITGDDTLLESQKLYAQIAETIAQNHTISNYQDNKLFMGNPNHVLTADIFMPRINTHDDSTWFMIGLARAAGIPIIPFWNEKEDMKFSYGFTKDIELNYKPLVRKTDDTRHWPSKTVDDLLLDLEQIAPENIKKNPRPGKEDINFNLPGYLVGDARHLENHITLYRLEEQLKAAGLAIINPARKLDDYVPERDFPTRMIGGEPPKPGEKTAVDWCFDAAGKESSFLVSRNKIYGLLGARWEEGVAYFFGKPIFYLDQYVFAHISPFANFSKGKMDEKAVYQYFVFKQNEERWGLPVSEGKIPADIAPHIHQLKEAYHTQK